MLAKDENVDNSQPMETVHTHELVTIPGAQFPGSFAPDSRHELKKFRSRRTRSLAVEYLTESWDDPSLWRSAVSLSIST